MTKRIDQVAVALSILNVCSSGATKTKIAVRANLNYMAISPYLENLKNKGLLDEILKGSKITYRTTPKGLEWKKRFEQSVALLEDIQVMA